MRLLPMLIISTFLLSCSTPNQFLVDGQIKKAFSLAQKKIKAGKNVDENKVVLIQAGNQLIKNQLGENLPLTQSQNVDDWVRAQNNYYNTLEKIVVANHLVEGQLQNSYDHLCTQKIELDFKIADHFYRKGNELLATHYEQLSKHHARAAYFQFQESLSFGGDKFFQDLSDKIEESLLEGRIYFVSKNFNPSTSLFFQPLPHDANFQADCIITADYGAITHTTNRSISHQSFSKEIEVGKQAIQDTSGMITYEPIFETVQASINTTTVTVTASSWTSIYSEDVTGYCFKSGETFHNAVSDSYEETSASGDLRALDHNFITTVGTPSFFYSDLESALFSEIESDLFFW